MRKAFVAMFCALSIAAAGAVSLSEIVGNDKAAQLRAGSSVKEMRVRVSDLSLVPSVSERIQMTADVADFNPDIVVEALYLYKKPSSARGRAWNESERLMVFNVLRSLSTLSGIEYFSASRGKMRIFYERSTVVADASGAEALPDPVVEGVPERSTLYAVQKDLTFGENRYRYDYVASASGISFAQTNLTTMSYGIVPLLGKERLRTIVLVSDTDEGILLYAVSAAKATLLPGLEGKIKNSFSNRADAIYGWFSQQADAAFSRIDSLR